MHLFFDTTAIQQVPQHEVCYCTVVVVVVVDVGVSVVVRRTIISMKKTKNETKVSALVGWLKQTTPVREGSGLITVRDIFFHIFDGCHDYCTHDVSNLK